MEEEAREGLGVEVRALLRHSLSAPREREQVVHPRLAKEEGDVGVSSVDRRQRTSAEGIYAAGDCADTFHLITGQPVHIALGTVANKQGRVAGVNLAGGYAAFPGVLGTAVSKVCANRTGPPTGK